MVQNRQCLLKYKFTLSSEFIPTIHGYCLQSAYECLDEIHQHKKLPNGKYRNNQSNFAGKGISVTLFMIEHMIIKFNEN